MLRQRGFDIESCEEAGRANRRVSDADHLEYASQAGHAVLTFNYNDFIRLDAEWKRAGREHAGIIVSHEIHEFRTLLRRVERHLNSIPPEVQHNTLLWLDSSPV